MHTGYTKHAVARFSQCAMANLLTHPDWLLGPRGGVTMCFVGQCVTSLIWISVNLGSVLVYTQQC